MGSILVYSRGSYQIPGVKRSRERGDRHNYSRRGGFEMGIPDKLRVDEKVDLQDKRLFLEYVGW